MKSFLINRILLMVPTIIGSLTIVFLALQLIPGDPAIIMLGEYATQEQIINLRTTLGLDKPVLVQYFSFLTDYLTGNFGVSLRSGRSVLLEILARMPYTIELAVASVIIAVLVGVPIGIISALRKNTFVDYMLTTLSISGVAAPSFWLGLILIVIFSVNLGWFPIIGAGEDTLFNIRYLILPATAIGLSMAALLARITRSNTLEVLGEDYVRTARAKGVKESMVIFKHVLKNAAIPIVTILGLYMGHLLGGAVIIETVFGRAGIGKYLIDSIYARDYPAVQASTFVIVLLFLIINLVVDMFYTILNPKIRY